MRARDGVRGTGVRSRPRPEVTAKRRRSVCRQAKASSGKRGGRGPDAGRSRLRGRGERVAAVGVGNSHGLRFWFWLRSKSVSSADSRSASCLIPFRTSVSLLSMSVGPRADARSPVRTADPAGAVPSRSRRCHRHHCHGRPAQARSGRRHQKLRGRPMGLPPSFWGSTRAKGRAGRRDLIGAGVGQVVEQAWVAAVAVSTPLSSPRFLRRGLPLRWRGRRWGRPTISRRGC